MRSRYLAICLLACAAVAASASAREPGGEALDLARFKGKVVLLDFWASWCAPCKASFPWMQQLHQRYAGNDLVVIAVNVDHERTPAERFLQGQRADFPIVFDPSGQIAERFEVHSMPASFYIDRTGRVRYTHAGFRSADTLESESELAALIAEH